MVVKKPRIVIIGAGMAGLVAANKLYTCARSKEVFEISIVEGGSRIGGRINTWEFGGDQIELGATWIHGIGGSPIHRIAEEIGALESEQPWEHRDGYPNSNQLLPIMEGGYRIDPCIVETISKLYRKMMEFAQGELEEDEDIDYYNNIAAKAYKICTSNGYSGGELGLGSFLRKCLDGYWVSRKDDKNNNVYCNLSRKLLEEAVFEIHENAERAHTSASDLSNLDYNAESEYLQFPEEEITIAKGYLSIIKHLASVLPAGLIQLGRKVRKIEWKSEGTTTTTTTTAQMVNGNGGSSRSSSRPVKLHFEDGSILFADHVIITVSLGVLKAGIREESGMFSPPLPSFKIDAISRLGFGIVNKLFVQLNTTHDLEHNNYQRFPYLQMGFHRSDSELRNQKIPWWMRRTDSLCPIYKNSSVLLSWFTGKEALKLESLNDDEIINGVSTTVSSFLLNSQTRTRANSHQCISNGNGKSMENSSSSEFKFTKIINSRWGTDPLFLGSYSYVAVGSSGDDLDIMAEPLPRTREDHEVEEFYPPLQILFAGEATHRRQYSTTHGAYFSGEREALRLLKHYKCDGF